MRSMELRKKSTLTRTMTGDLGGGTLAPTTNDGLRTGITLKWNSLLGFYLLLAMPSESSGARYCKLKKFLSGQELSLDIHSSDLRLVMAINFDGQP
jgi:hypothetical protein